MSRTQRGRGSTTSHLARGTRRLRGPGARLLSGLATWLALGALVAPGALAAPAAAVAAAPAQSGQSAQQHFPADNDLRLMLRYLVEDGEAPGIVLGVLEADGTRRVFWHGNAGQDAQMPLGPKSVFEMASITKTFTGTLLAEMVGRGEVALDDPVSKHLPEAVSVPSRNGREITLLDLATHRSALPRMPDNMDRGSSQAYPEYTIEDLYEFLSSHELRRDIGSEYEYSNIGVALLGHALERAAGRSYEELLRERILDPLGMRLSSTRVEGELRRWNTQGHDGDGAIAPYRDWPNLPAMGALRSNVEDMLAYLAANIAAARGDSSSRLHRAMRSAQTVRAPVNEDADIGLNWVVRRIGDRRVITHSGGTRGYSTRVAFDPGLGVGVALLTNTSEFDDDIDLDFLRHGPPLAIREAPVPVTVLERYVGEYEAASGRTYIVRLEPEGWLTVQGPGNVRFRMYAESDTSFFAKRTSWRFWFTRDGSGGTARMVADLEGNERRATKVSDAGPPPAFVAGNAPPPDLPMSAAEMGRYVGQYAIQAGTRTLQMRVFIEDGELRSRAAGQAATRLMYQGGNEFRLAAAPDIRLVFTMEDGRAGAVALHQGGSVYHGTRSP